MRIFLLCCLGMLLAGDCLSQQYPFVHYTPRDGLVNNRARFMVQDSRGLLYISTFGGLSVYDGVRFTNYTTDNGLSASLVNDVIEMGEDSLWIVPNFRSLHCLVKGRIKNIITSDGYYPIVNKMIHGGDGLWYCLADEGLFRFENNHYRKIDLIDSTGNDASRFILTGTAIGDKLFLITDANIHVFPGDGRLIMYDTKTGKVCVSDLKGFADVISSPQKEILISGVDGIRQLNQQALSENKIVFDPIPSIYKPFEKGITGFIFFDRQQNFWGATNNGVIKLDPEGKLTFYSVANGLIVNGCTSIFQDRENIMWFTNDETGISKLANPRFEFYPQFRPGFLTTDIYASEKSDSVWFLDGIHNKVLLQ